MANTKISNLTALGAAPATDDVLVVVDTSASETKKMTVANLLSLILNNANTYTADITVSAILTGDSVRGKGLAVRSDSASPALLSFTEVGVADRGVIGYAAASGDLVYRGSAFSISSGTEHWRTTTAGYFLLGYTASNGAYRLQVNSQIFATNATIATSDARVKTNVAELDEGLAVIERLRPVTFDFVEHEVHNFSRERQVGFLAQDVEEALGDVTYLRCVVPQIEDEEQLRGMADAKLVPVLVRAVQELSARLQGVEAGLLDLAMGGM